MKLFLKILNGLVTAAVLAMVLGTILLAISARRSTDAIPTVLDRKVLTVLSGSMEPVIHTGDVIIVRPITPADEVKEGDIITFRTKEEASTLITHRVMGTVSVNGKPAAYVTKGDANNSEDVSTVARDQILGLYQWRVPYFGYVATFLRKPVGVILVVILPGLTLIGLELRKIWRILVEAEAAKAKGGEQPRT